MRSLIPLLVLSLTLCLPMLDGESTKPSAPESPPESVQPERLYTASEVLQVAAEAAEAAAKTAAEESAKAVTAELLPRLETEARRAAKAYKELRAWQTWGPPVAVVLGAACFALGVFTGSINGR